MGIHHLHNGCMLGTVNTVTALLNYVDEGQREFLLWVAPTI
jgi:hypothetical protein